MEFVLTIKTNDPNEIVRFLSLPAGTPTITLAAAPGSMPAPPHASTEDDDNTVNTNAPAVDATGLPWDERIHSAGKALTDKGVWRKKRGVDAATIAAVEAQLKAGTHPVAHAAPVPIPMPAAVAPITTAVPIPTMPPAAPAPMAQPYNPPVAPMPAAPMPVPTPPPAAPVAPGGQVQPMQHDVMDFHTFMQNLSASMAGGRVDASYAASIASRFGLTAITDVNAKPEMIPYVVATMRAERRFPQADGSW